MRALTRSNSCISQRSSKAKGVYHEQEKIAINHLRLHTHACLPDLRQQRRGIGAGRGRGHYNRAERLEGAFFLSAVCMYNGKGNRTQFQSGLSESRLSDSGGRRLRNRLVHHFRTENHPSGVFQKDRGYSRTCGAIA